MMTKIDPARRFPANNEVFLIGFFALMGAMGAGNSAFIPLNLGNCVCDLHTISFSVC